MFYVPGIIWLLIACAVAVVLSATSVLVLLKRKITLSALSLSTLVTCLTVLQQVGSVWQTTVQVSHMFQRGYDVVAVYDCLMDERGRQCSGDLDHLGLSTPTALPNAKIQTVDPASVVASASSEGAPTPRQPGSASPLPNLKIGVPSFNADKYETVDYSLVLLHEALSKESLNSLKFRARAGDREANYLLGVAADYGIPNGHIDLVAARKAYRESWKKSFPRAAVNYSSMLRNGWGGPENKAEGLNVLKECIKLPGHAPCSYSLGQIYQETNPAMARAYFEEAAALGYAGAKTVLAADIWSGGPSNPNDVEAQSIAFRLYERAASEGSASSMAELGDAYRWGVFYNKDKSLAVDLLTQAARLGDPDAAVEAADMLVHGEGTATSPDAAAELLEPLSCGVPDCQGGDWQATDSLAGLIINHLVKPIPGRDSEIMARRSIDNGYAQSLRYLLSELQFGKDRDFHRAAIVAQYGYDHAQHCAMDQECAWPMYAFAFARGIRSALAKGIVAEQFKGQAEQLKQLYGELDSHLMRITIPIECAGLITRSEIYVWDAQNAQNPADKQFDWLEKDRGCSVPANVRAAFDQVYGLAQRSHTSFIDKLTERFLRESADTVGAARANFVEHPSQKGTKRILDDLVQYFRSFTRK